MLPAQRQKQCPRCGQLNIVTAAVCSACGHQFRTQFAPDPTVAMPAQNPVQNPGPQPQYQPPPQTQQPQVVHQYIYVNQSAKMIQKPPGLHDPRTAVAWCFVLMPAGGIYNGQTAKSVMAFVICCIIGLFSFGLSILLYWPIAMIDTYLIAKKLQRGEAVGIYEWF